MSALPPPVVFRRAVRDSDLDSSAKLVGFVIAEYMNPDGVARPSKETIARGGSLSVRAADAGVRRLEASSLLLVERSPKGGRTKANRYLVNPAAAAGIMGANPAGGAGITAETPQQTTVNPAAASDEEERRRTSLERGEESRASGAKVKKPKPCPYTKAEDPYGEFPT